jgi:hypothetical protein
VSKPKPEVRTCGMFGESGHSIRTCPQMKAVSTELRQDLIRTIEYGNKAQGAYLRAAQDMLEGSYATRAWHESMAQCRWDQAGNMKNFHLPLPEPTHSLLRAEAQRTQRPATTLGRQAIDGWLRDQARKTTHDAIAAYAAEVAGTELDLDCELESAGIRTSREVRPGSQMKRGDSLLGRSGSEIRSRADRVQEASQRRASPCAIKSPGSTALSSRRG